MRWERWVLVAALGAAGVAGLLMANGTALRAEPKKSAKSFDVLADRALEAMKKRATDLKIGGVAVVAYRRRYGAGVELEDGSGGTGLKMHRRPGIMARTCWELRTRRRRRWRRH